MLKIIINNRNKSPSNGDINRCNNGIEASIDSIGSYQIKKAHTYVQSIYSNRDLVCASMNPIFHRRNLDLP